MDSKTRRTGRDPERRAEVSRRVALGTAFGGVTAAYLALAGIPGDAMGTDDATPAPDTVPAGTPALPSNAGEGITLAGSGLENPRGFTWGADGSFYVALAGSGGPRESDGTSGEEHVLGTFRGGLTGSVAYVDTDSCPVTFQGDLPSGQSSNSGNTRGPAAVTLIGGDVFVAVAGGGTTNANPTTPNGVYTLAGDGSALILADLSAWTRDNPVAAPPGDFNPDGDPFAMVVGNNELFLTEANSGQLLRVGRDGEVTRLVDFSGTHEVPTGLARAADGTLYVGFLTGAPYVDGAATVVSVTPDGTVTTVWEGLTAVTALAIGPDGSLFALEMGTGNTASPPFVGSGTGRVVRQTGPASLAEVAIGLDRPVAMGFGPDGGLYVALPAFGGSGRTGAIVRLNLDQGQTLVMDPALLQTSTCPGANPSPSQAASSAPDGNETPAADNGDATAGNAVSIENFTFTPAALQVTAGTTVTWTNADSSAHTVTADDNSFDSGNLAPGGTFTYTFSTAGTIAYHCTYHPNMTATIVVQ